jgi:hypothetical protein
MVITRSAVRRVIDEAPDLAQRPGGRAAISSMVEGAAAGLSRLAAAVLIVAAVGAALSLAKLDWGRRYLVLVAAVVVGAAVVAAVGVSITTILLGVVLGVVVFLLGQRLLPPAPGALAAPPG